MSDVIAYQNTGNGSRIPVSTARPLPVQVEVAVGAGIAWGAPTAVAVLAGPASTEIPAVAGTKRLVIWNPATNGTMYIDVSGGVAAAATGRPLLAGRKLDLTNPDISTQAVTFIGVAGQSLIYQRGT